jgi:hypothetical protein
MKESTAVVLALVTIVAAFYLMDLTNAQGVTWRSANKGPAPAPVAEASK